MDLQSLTDEELCQEWDLFNTILKQCDQSQSQYDIDMRDMIESEIVRRGGEIELALEEDHQIHKFNGFDLLKIKV